MPKLKNPTEILADEFIENLKKKYSNVDPIKVLRSRAYGVSNANFLIRAATLTGNGRYFFGLNYITAEEVANLENSFFVFICGSTENTLIFPSSFLIKNLPFISHDRNGEYKIVFDTNLQLVLLGRNNRMECNKYINAWDQLNSQTNTIKTTAEESYHSVLQGRLIEIGNIRGYHTFCPNKSKLFNGKPLSQISTLSTCPNLQFSDYNLLRQIDVIWFREKAEKYIPECAFEVEISTGTWSGVGRLATLIDYANMNLYIISDELQKYNQVIRSFSDYKNRYKHIATYLIGDLYAAERNLKDLRYEIGL
jgi:hypothetical protein